MPWGQLPQAFWPRDRPRVTIARLLNLPQIVVLLRLWSFPVLRPLAESTEPKFMLELFAGTAVLTSTCRGACNLNVLHPIEIQNSSIFDPRRRRTQAVILEGIRSNKIWYVHLGTPCTIWSQARRGIRDLVKARDEERVGIELAIFQQRS